MGSLCTVALLTRNPWRDEDGEYWMRFQGRDCAQADGGGLGRVVGERNI